MYVKKPISKPRKDGPRNGKWSNEILMGTWNVQTMLQPGRMVDIAQEIINFNLDLVALHEIRWQGQGRIDKSKYTLIYSGPSNKTGPLGTGFILTKRIRDSLLEVEPMNGRLCRIRIKGIFRNITIIAAYAPTEVKEEYEKEEFYHMLERTCERVPKHDQIIILGDFNAQFALRNNLFISSTAFPNPKIHLGTWKIPGTTEVNQIDHMICSQRYKSSIIDVRSGRGPNVDSDHYLVRAKTRQRIAIVRGSKEFVKQTKHGM
jgi:hypothetical protein